MKWDSQTQQWAIGGAIVVVLVVAGWWFFTGSPEEANTNIETATTTQSTSTATTTNNGRPSVSVNTGELIGVDDQPAGDRVIVADTKLSRVSWIAVRDDMRIYGAARVNPPQGGGTMTDVTIPLLRNTEAGKTYSVVVYADDGDNAFDFKKDALVDGLDDTFTATNGD